MHDLNSEIWLDARGDFCWMRARARAALNARPVAKTDALIVFLSEFWV